jgi:8-oxo-dGTP pyrophosphatase MutT (NUDIX family)
MPLLAFDAYIERLRTRLAGPLPGPAAQRTMAPSVRPEPSLQEMARYACREAGVLALLFPQDDAPNLVLTVRRAHLRQHAGQISFPGGRREAGETLQEAALRETHEEIGLAPDQVDVLGSLTPLYIPPSNYCVYPFVGVAARPPDLRPHDYEVERILQIAVTHLLGPQVRVEEEWTLRGQPVQVPFFSVDGHKIWGATAMMLAELLALSAGEVASR